MMRAKHTMAIFLASLLTICAGFARAAEEADREYRPLSRFAPQYPEHCVGPALLSDYVVVEYDITVDGTTENIRIADSSNECFHESAIDAVTEFRFEPRMLAGTPVPVEAVRDKFTFTLAAMRDAIERELEPVNQQLFDGDGAGALQSLAGFEAAHRKELSRYEYATFLWMRGVANMLENDYPAARADLSAALDTGDLYPETVDMIQSLLSEMKDE